MKMILNWLASALVILTAAYLLPGVHVASFITALVVAIVLGVVNAFLKPILILLTLPLTILTLGLFTFVINALLILLTAKIVPGFVVDGFWWAVLFGIVLSVINFILHKMSRT